MFNLRYISIKQKLILMQVVTSICVLIVCFIFFIISHISDYKQKKSENLISLAGVISTNSLSALQFDDNQAAKNILGDLEAVAPEIKNAAILNKTHQVFAAYTRNDADTFLFNQRVIRYNSPEFTTDGIIVNAPIIDVTDTLGVVCLRSGITELKGMEKRQYQMALAILAMGVGFAFIIALLVTPYLSNRINYLVKTMHEIKLSSDYSRQVNEEGNDEISSLAFVFNNLMERVQENLQKKDEFIGIASHELKTPLTSVKGYLQLLDTIEDRPRNQEIIKKSLAAVGRQESLIHDLLDVSKIQSGQLFLDISDFDIISVIRDCINSIQITAQHHRIVLHSEDNSRLVRGDQQRIEQVILNLLSNAVKYSPNGELVEVFCEMRDDKFYLRVRDYGIGISPEERERVFERFYRTKDNSILISGFGLGLFISKDIIYRHGGKIWVEPANPGTVLNFYLPIT